MKKEFYALLFPRPQSHLCDGILVEKPLKSLRQRHAEEVAKMKSDHGIFTHNCPGGGDWMALSMPECIKALESYGLTDDEKTNGVALMAGYCRLLDDAGLIEEGQATEFLACTALVRRITNQIRLFPDERP